MVVQAVTYLFTDASKFELLSPPPPIRTLVIMELFHVELKQDENWNWNEISSCTKQCHDER